MEIPKDIHLEILSILDVNSLLNMSVNKYWHSLTNNKYVWNLQLFNRFHITDDSPKSRYIKEFKLYYNIKRELAKKINYLDLSTQHVNGGVSIENVYINIVNRNITMYKPYNGNLSPQNDGLHAIMQYNNTLDHAINSASTFATFLSSLGNSTKDKLITMKAEGYDNVYLMCLKFKKSIEEETEFVYEKTKEGFKLLVL